MMVNSKTNAIVFTLAWPHYQLLSRSVWGKGRKVEAYLFSCYTTCSIKSSNQFFNSNFVSLLSIHGNTLSACKTG